MFLHDLSSFSNQLPAESYGASGEGYRPYRHLAIKVLARAVLDIVDPGSLSCDRESARAFLSGSPMLQHWCRVAELDPVSVAEHLRRFTNGLPPSPFTGSNHRESKGPAFAAAYLLPRNTQERRGRPKGPIA